MFQQNVEQRERVIEVLTQKGFDADRHGLAWDVVNKRASTHTLLFSLLCSIVPFSFKSSFPLQVLRGVQKNMLGSSSWLGKSKRV